MIPVTLGRRVLTAASRPYVIAEIGVNHEGSMDQARRLIELAHQGGADAAKFQSYKADTLASADSPAYWDTTLEPTRTQHALFRKYDAFGEAEYLELAAHCARVGIDFVSTPFDDAAIDFLDPVVPFFKVASADLTNTPFLRRVAAKGKVVVLSTGASTMLEIDAALETLIAHGCPDVVLLHCVLNYPTLDADAHLRMITGLKSAYPDRLVGYSDHTVPDEQMTALMTAHVLGAVVIEKHFTHDKQLSGNDHYHAMDAGDLARFVAQGERVHALLGTQVDKAPIPSEAEARLHARRSIVLARSVRAGHQISASDLTYKRPGTGVSPSRWDDVVGRSAVRDLGADHVLQWSDVDVARSGQ